MANPTSENLDSTVDKNQLKRNFDRDGFIRVRNFVVGEELDELRTHLDRYIRETLPKLPKSAAFYQDPKRPETLKQMQHMGADPFLGDYAQRDKWCDIAQAILGEDVDPQQPEWFNKPPGTPHAPPPHQDNYYFCLKPPNVCTLWLALDPIDRSNGCLRYVPGSHRLGIRPHKPTKVLGFSQGITDYGPDDEGIEQAMELAPGDLIAHHGETIHLAAANPSPRHRRAFAIVYYGQSCQRDSEAYARYTSAMQAQHGEFGITASASDDATSS